MDTFLGLVLGSKSEILLRLLVILTEFISLIPVPTN
jgi:hypothetical protein